MLKRFAFFYILLLFLSSIAFAQNVNRLDFSLPHAVQQWPEQQVSMCVSAVPGHGYVVGGNKYVITQQSFEIHTDIENRIRSVYGNSAKLADWQALKGLLSTRHELAKFIDQVGIPLQRQNGPCGNFLVSMNGQLRIGNGLWLFLARHDGNVPNNWSVLDSIDNHTFDLGRWFWESQALIVVPQNTVNPPIVATNNPPTQVSPSDVQSPITPLPHAPPEQSPVIAQKPDVEEPKPSTQGGGALAMTPPDHVMMSIFTWAFSLNEPDVNGAARIALSGCRNADADLQMRAFSGMVLGDRCKVVKLFHHQCFAVARDKDPQSGKASGAGWAVEDDLQTAQAEALAMCEKNVVNGRNGMCVLAPVAVSCDTQP